MRKVTSSHIHFLGRVVGCWMVSSAFAWPGIIFTDNFDSSARAPTQNGASWGGNRRTAVSASQASSGNYSLEFTFEGGPSGADAFAEQRISLPPRPAYWFKYRLYIPQNYAHRTQATEGTNNKFLAVYRDPYGAPGFQVNFSLQPNGNGGSHLDAHHYRDGREQRIRRAANDFITSSDRGKWIEIVAEIRVPSSPSAYDGVMRLTKNGQVVASITDLGSWGGEGMNYIDEAYFLGWANSGFDQTTLMYIDDVEISDTPFGTTTPSPPTNVIVR